MGFFLLQRASSTRMFLLLGTVSCNIGGVFFFVSAGILWKNYYIGGRELIQADLRIEEAERLEQA